MSEFVSNPNEFCNHRANTAFVVMDQTALWLKVRGEDKLVFHAEDTVS